jgi:integrase
VTFKQVGALYLDRHALGPDVGPRHSKKGKLQGCLLGPDGEPCDVWEFVPTTGRPRKRTWKEDRRKLEVDIVPRFGRMPIADIMAADVRELIESIAYRGAPTAANRTRALLSKVFNFARARGLVEVNPVDVVDKPAKERRRERKLDDKEIRILWEGTETFKSQAMRALFRLLLLTGQRLSEVRDMTWDELDLEERVWTIPGARTKNRRTHRVPLTDPALEIITGLRRFDDYVLAGARGNRQTYEAKDELGIEDFQLGRDLRTAALTLMMAGGISEFDGGQVLNHSPRSVTGRHYNRYEYDAEKRIALETLARQVAAIVDRKDGGAVVPFSRR